MNNTTTTNDPLQTIIQSNLHPGDIIKNYKELCNILHDEPKTSDSKKAQENEWQRYIKWERKGHKYIIVEIYNKPLEKNDKRSLGNKSIYVQHIELLLLNYLSKQKDQSATLTLKNWLLLLGMINPNYLNDNKENIKLMLQDNNISDYQINHFYQRTYQKLKEIIFSSLKNLRNRRLIDYDELTIINVTELINNKTITMERIATEEERNIIRDTEKEVLKEMGLESITLVHLKFKSKEYYNKVNYLLRERYKINYTYKDIKILFTHKYIIEALEQAELNIQKLMLNDKVVNVINEQAQRNLEKSIKEYNQQIDEYMEHIIGEPNNIIMNKFFKLDEIYVYTQEKLAELLIKL
jgi:hypothetical protein